jgi:CHAD domain-containing protein
MPVDQQRVKLVFDKLDRQLAKLGSNPQPNNIHQFRTYSRRLQAILEEISPKLKKGEKKLLKTLGRLRRRAGRVRDLDVQIAALRSLKIPQEPRRKTQLLRILAERRISREKKFNRSLDSETIRWLRKRLKKTAGKYAVPESTQPLNVARTMLLEVSKPHSSLTEELLHQYRIAGKRVRYVSELAGKDAEAKPFLESLKTMQDALGDWHDWLLLTQTSEEIFSDVQDSPLLTALRNITGAKYRHAVQVVTDMRAALFAPPAAADVKPRGRELTVSPKPVGSERGAARAATA